MLKEMMDVKPPLTAIQTPVKDTTAKKFPQRRSSKSEEQIDLQSIIDSGMANVPSPLKRMDSSAESSSSYETESSESDSEDSSSGSQTGVENPETNKVTPVVSPSCPPRWNLGSFIRKENFKGTPDSSVPVAPIDKSPSDLKPKESTTALSTPKSENVSEVQAKTDSNVSSTSVLGKSLSASPIEPAAIVIPRKSPRLIQELALQNHTFLLKIPHRPFPRRVLLQNSQM
jgi:hypothetical protein